jgi:glycosyltransferase involved in cell wall biosynthesis
MKIAVNTRLLIRNKLDGIGWFTFETLNRITKKHPEHQFYFIFDRKFSPEFVFSSNVTPVIAWPPARHPFLWFLFFEIGLPKALRKIKPDVFVSTDGWCSLSTKVKTINVIHDLNFEHYPQFLPFLVRTYYLYFFPKFARKAERLVTVSEFSKQDLIRKYKIAPNKIDVVYNGFSTRYKPVDELIIEKTRVKYSTACPYFLFVGTIHSRKNIANQIKAFAVFKTKWPGNKIKLLLVGEKKWMTTDICEAYDNSPFRDEVIFTGRVGDNELERILASALALVYVSYFEGFGIPILEAMACGVPVITSNTSSMPEVAGDAALLANPFNPDEIALCMEQLAKDTKLRNALINAGFVRLKLFSWDNSAAQLWTAIEKVL